MSDFLAGRRCFTTVELASKYGPLVRVRTWNRHKGPHGYDDGLIITDVAEGNRILKSNPPKPPQYESFLLLGVRRKSFGGRPS